MAKTKKDQPPLLLTKRVKYHPHDPPPAVTLERELRFREIFGEWMNSSLDRLPIKPKEN